MSYPELQLSAQLCFLVHRLQRGIGALYRPMLSELGLTYTQYIALLALWERDQLGVGEMCSLLAMDTGTVSPVLKRLEHAGLVQRVRETTDERTVSVRLTAKGRRLEQKARRVPQALSAGLSSSLDEYHELHRLFSDLVQRVETAAQQQD